MLGIELERAVSDQTKANGIGWQTLSQWQSLERVLSDYQALSKRVEPSGVFTDEYLKRVYKNGKIVWP